jgi:hypothetical protein
MVSLVIESVGGAIAPLSCRLLERLSELFHPGFGAVYALED